MATVLTTHLLLFPTSMVGARTSNWTMENYPAGLAGADIGILANLGDVALDTLSLNDPLVSFLATYKPTRREREARVEQERLRYGFSVDGIYYRRTLPGLVDSTYLVRSVVYRTSDMLVAFRVVREDTDGSLIIAWKRLKRYGTPNLDYLAT